MKNPEDPNCWEGLYSWRGRIRLLSPYSPERSKGSMQSLSRYSDILHRIRKNNFQFIWKHTRPQITTAILSKKNQLRASQYLRCIWAKVTTTKSTDIKTDRKTSEAAWKIQKQNHSSIVNWFLRKAPKRYIRQKTASSKMVLGKRDI